MRTKWNTRSELLGRARLFAVVGLAVAGAVRASADGIPRPNGDPRPRAAEKTVRTSVYLGVFDYVVVDVDDGRVRLRGSVEQRGRGKRAAEQVAALPGVVEVVNEIRVQSGAPEDVQLRRRLFERLYYGGGMPADPRPEWPVRILVSEGRVTLAGELPQGAELARLQAMAWEAGALSVDLQPRDEDAPERRAGASY
jgi:osmotically-inducible protein OsmY